MMLLKIPKYYKNNLALCFLYLKMFDPNLKISFRPFRLVFIPVFFTNIYHDFDEDPFPKTLHPSQ
jgi:hypothetical protein